LLIIQRAHALTLSPYTTLFRSLMAMRVFMRGKHVDGTVNTQVLEQVGLTQAQVEDMYRYLAIANYEDRFVIPTAHREMARDAYRSEEHTSELQSRENLVCRLLL